MLRTNYDAAWLPSTLCLDSIGCLMWSASYTALNQPLQWNFSGVVQSWGYSAPQARLQTLQVGSAINRSYGYDAGGNVTAITDNAVSPAQVENERYDHRDRLVQAYTTGNGTNAYNESYAYSTIGNLTSKAGVSYAYPAGGSARPHTPTNVGGGGLSYDANGNLTQGAGHSFVYNGRNLATSITGPDGVTETYQYDGDGERVARTRGSVTTVYIAGVVEEDVGGAQRELYPFGSGAVVAMLTGGGFSFLHGDHLGSISAVSSGGTVTNQQRYDAWGKVRSGDIPQTTLDYTGQRKDDTGLLYYHARYYDPSLGRFVSPDSIVPGADALNATANGKGAGPGDPQQLNRYSYVSNNPLKFTDPTGHSQAGGGGKAKKVRPPSKSNPFKGKPGSSSTTYQDDGTPKQVRTYAPDGYPDTDVDYDHDHGQGQPHKHKWQRPADGSPPTAADRGPGEDVGSPITGDDADAYEPTLPSLPLPSTSSQAAQSAANAGATVVVIIVVILLLPIGV